MYNAKREYDTANSARPKDDSQILSLATALSAARTAARDAQHDFDSHVHEHHCEE
jgi:hypothetical protein